MSSPITDPQRYIINVKEREDDSGVMVFTFVPEDSQPLRSLCGTPPSAPHYILTIGGKEANGMMLDWGSSPVDPGPAKSELERVAAQRARARWEWTRLVGDLVAQVESWARELGWSTRRIEKKLDDAEIGRHRLPVLLMQEGTCRVMLEPVGRSAPAAEGIVDLYLMSAYDDIASLYYYNGRWNLHCLTPGMPPVADIRDAVAMPLSKEGLAKVLEAMHRYAA